ncbi:MAG: hypothetical protein M3Y87_10155 [Myxococcota bacterium]|nr:hypothetical protein [Myxococcota bacterium]
MRSRSWLGAALVLASGTAVVAAAQPVDRIASARSAVAEVRTRCDQGAPVHAAFAMLSPPQLDALAADGDRTLRLLVHWERERRVLDAGLDPDGITRFLRALRSELGRPAPAWWATALRSARVHAATSTTSYTATPARASRFTERIEWGSRTFVAPAAMASLDGIPPPLDATLDHVDAIRTGARIVVVPFSPGSGGFPLEVRAYRAGPVELAWRSTACAAGRQVLGGVGELAIELEITAEEVRVWSAESHGLAIDAFDLATGAPRWRFSTDFWSARHGP